MYVVTCKHVDYNLPTEAVSNSCAITSSFIDSLIRNCDTAAKTCYLRSMTMMAAGGAKSQYVMMADKMMEDIMMGGDVSVLFVRVFEI